ncbi:uncharacterized protein BO96DRAFT_403574 [Aspergillus niger CBS 101883]|uniref:uncharacterized protein n=1 Tax=Aspergillus lacticoffeatus (strain CBS 101883) TaxID=1450533 RepID=UPI000D7FD8BF|nr:uncharacterized protein BO96DRAFT_403574 [Aspergillus niger CBS 101883]PYH51710.1 hypothetical protein BO96DRAFT_403574 [Aspergillus niger CBS 101883]
MQMDIFDWLGLRDKDGPRVPQPTPCISEENPCMMLCHTYGFALLYGHAVLTLEICGPGSRRELTNCSSPTTRTQDANYYSMRVNLIGDLQLPRSLSHHETRRSRQSFGHLLWERAVSLAQQVGEYSGNPRNFGTDAKPARERDLNVMVPCLWRREAEQSLDPIYSTWHSPHQVWKQRLVHLAQATPKSTYIACLQLAEAVKTRLKRGKLIPRVSYGGNDGRQSGEVALSMDRHE